MDKTRCEVCGKLMFAYKMKHNGQEEVVKRCHHPHRGFNFRPLTEQDKKLAGGPSILI